MTTVCISSGAKTGFDLREVNVADVENTEIEAFLWDNPIDMNALDDMHSLRKQEA